jgi:hypothetical protein
MNRKHQALVSVVAIIGLLAFVFSSWVKQAPAAASELHIVAKHHFVYKAGPASAAVYLAEIKPRLFALVAGAVAAAVGSPLWTLSQPYKNIAVAQGIADLSRPLWLINRSLLI